MCVISEEIVLKFHQQLFKDNSLDSWRTGSCFCLKGGLFGSSTFSQPATSSTSTGFGFGAVSGASTNLFGNSGTGTTGGLFSQPNNAFSANKPTSFGSEFHYCVCWTFVWINQCLVCLWVNCYAKSMQAISLDWILLDKSCQVIVNGFKT